MLMVGTHPRPLHAAPILGPDEKDAILARKLLGNVAHPPDVAQRQRIVAHDAQKAAPGSRPYHAASRCQGYMFVEKPRVAEGTFRQHKQQQVDASSNAQMQAATDSEPI